MSQRDRHVSGLSAAEVERARRALELMRGNEIFQPAGRPSLSPEERKAKRARWRKNKAAREATSCA